MKKLFLTLLLLLNVFCVLAQQQTTECICLQKAFGLDTVKVYADCSNDKKHACDQFTKIELLKNNGEKYIVWAAADTNSIENKRRSLINIECHGDNYKEELIVYYVFFRGEYKVTKFLRSGYDTWKSITYALPINAYDFGSNGNISGNSFIIQWYNTSLPEPIIYLINSEGKLVEYREGKVVDENTVPYKSKMIFKEH